jgi:V-type H+-transporting ATPase subunit a
MGFFSLYCGFIYNDFTSIPLKLFGDSCFETEAHGKIPLKKDCVYPVGVDPAWYLGTNELAFMNSQKMKLAVILGVLQMSFGVCMKGLNSIYFGRKVDFFFEFLP